MCGFEHRAAYRRSHADESNDRSTIGQVEPRLEDGGKHKPSPNDSKVRGDDEEVDGEDPRVNELDGVQEPAAGEPEVVDEEARDREDEEGDASAT